MADLFLGGALEVMTRAGAQAAEACAADVHGQTWSDAFIYPGMRAVFEGQGFSAMPRSGKRIGVVRRRL
ncbi:MAG: hypothetical protein ABFD13_00180 [Candidatus Cryosericum sp.]|nr:hypothetical protein [bacterium]